MTNIAEPITHWLPALPVSELIDFCDIAISPAETAAMRVFRTGCILFNERSQCRFQGREELLVRYLEAPKGFIVVSNTMRETFLSAFCYHVLKGTEPEVFLSSREYGRRSLDGDLISCSEVLRKLAAFAGLDS